MNRSERQHSGIDFDTYSESRSSCFSVENVGALGGGLYVTFIRKGNPSSLPSEIYILFSESEFMCRTSFRGLVLETEYLFISKRNLRTQCFRKGYICVLLGRMNVKDYSIIASGLAVMEEPDVFARWRSCKQELGMVHTVCMHPSWQGPYSISKAS